MTDTTTPEATTGDTDAGLVDQDGIVLTRTGWVRMTIGSDLYRLRRPFFGEMRDLRLALEAVTDQVSAAGDTADKLAAEVVEEAKAARERIEAAGGVDEPTPADRKRVDKLRDKARAAGRQLIVEADDLRLGWWTQVFERLCVDTPKVPADWPSWVVDPNLPHKVMEHWRSAPLAPGA